MDYRILKLQERPDLIGQVDQLAIEAWPAFLRFGDTPDWGHLYDTFGRYQILICDPKDNLMAVGHTVPIVWDGRTTGLPTRINEVIERGLECMKSPQGANTLSALAVMVAKACRRQGLSTLVLHQMRALALRHGWSSLIVPVRPILKSHYPLIPLEQYARWTREDGAPFDPWIRVHRRLGAELLEIAPKTVTTTGTVAQWEDWTGMPFPGSGQYVVPGALQPVVIDRERDVGVYEDPNVWMRHRIG